MRSRRVIIPTSGADGSWEVDFEAIDGRDSHTACTKKGLGWTVDKEWNAIKHKCLIARGMHKASRSILSFFFHLSLFNISWVAVSRILTIFQSHQGFHFQRG
jgi:hypothetical protein